jgi:predicted permease
MNLLPVILNAFVPIAFVILLGVFAGRSASMPPNASVLLSRLVLDYALPAELFNAMATISLASMPGPAFILASIAGYLGMFLVAFLLALILFKKPINASSLQALNSSFPNIAFIGIPIIIAVIGKAAIPYAVVSIIITSLVLPPIALTLLAAAAPGQAKTSTPVLILHSLWGALKQSVVWAPILGVLFALAHLHLPDFCSASLTLIGEATTGVALFALGLLLSGQTLKISLASLANTGFKNLLQPAAMFVIALAFGIAGPHLREIILFAALPTAPMTAMFALKFNVYTAESDASILMSTVLSLLTVGALIAFTN